MSAAIIILGYQDIPQRIVFLSKKKVQTLIEVGKINFKSSNQSNNLLPNFSGAKTEEVKQNILSTKVEEFATTSGGIQGRRTGYTTKKTEEEEKALELQKENEKLQRLVQDMAYMMTEQKESLLLSKEEYDRIESAQWE